MNAHLSKLIDLALAEDAPETDITSVAVFGKEGPIVTGILLAKENMMLSGLDIACQVFFKVSKKIKVMRLKQDGNPLKKGDIIAKVKGPVSQLLTAERVALNFLQHLSGVATLTNQFVQLARPHKAAILDTRKTIPGLRVLEKKAVRDGRGENHRMTLSDMYLIKDNHVEASGGIHPAIEKAKAHRAKSKNKKTPIEIETRNLKEVSEALEAGVEMILLDNMSLADIKKAVKLVQNVGTHGRAPLLEISGGVNLKTVKQLAATGVDRISIGALTHSVKASDISFEIVREEP